MRVDQALFASVKLRREPHENHAGFKTGRFMAGIVGAGRIGYEQPRPAWGTWRRRFRTERHWNGGPGGLVKCIVVKMCS